MTERGKISLFSAIIINLNVMIGAGIFINTVLLAHRAGAFGAAVYLLVGFIMAPLLWSFSQLATRYKGGNFYDYGASVSPFFGFITMLSYFVANQASSALAVHVAMSLCQLIIPALATIHTLVLDVIVIALFTFFNTYNVQVGKQIQSLFMVSKIIPILFVIVGGLLYFDSANFVGTQVDTTDVLSAVPFVLYAFMGFESTCSLSRLLKNPQQDGPRAMMIAYFGGIALVALFQTALYGSLGPLFSTLSSYLEVVPALSNKIVGSTGLLANITQALLVAGVALSALGSAYGVMYFNLWNLYELAQRNYLVGGRALARMNRFQVPAWCAVAQALLSASYLWLSYGNQVPLQHMAAFGIALAYTFCVVGLAVLIYNEKKRITFMPLVGIGSCVFLLGSCVQCFILDGGMAIVLLAILLGIGSLMFAWQRSRR